MAVRGFSCDDETGEILFYDIDDETGEPAVETLQTEPRTVETLQPEPIIKYTKFPKGPITKTKKFQNLKAKILAGENAISHRMLLIPTVIMIFPGIFCILLMILEIFLHVRCHKKNKHLKDESLFYRSPFHVVTSTFCGVCRDCTTASKIGHLQDKRRYRYDYLRGIAI